MCACVHARMCTGVLALCVRVGEGKGEGRVGVGLSAETGNMRHNDVNNFVHVTDEWLLRSPGFGVYPSTPLLPKLRLAAICTLPLLLLLPFVLPEWSRHLEVNCTSYRDLLAFELLINSPSPCRSPSPRVCDKFREFR